MPTLCSSVLGVAMTIRLREAHAHAAGGQEGSSPPAGPEQPAQLGPVSSLSPSPARMGDFASRAKSGCSTLALVGILVLAGFVLWSRLCVAYDEPESASSHLDPSVRNMEEKQYMLRLINQARLEAGAGPVVLGENVVAQLHAEAALEACYGGHWGRDGLKPYMRYSLAGGYQSNSENWAGNSHCVKWYDWSRPNDNIKKKIEHITRAWLGSEGHRETLLDPWHKKVNIGLAWDRYNLQAVQHFEGDYVEYASLPTLDGDILMISGGLKNGLPIKDGMDFVVTIAFDPPPHPLTTGQIARTYCYDPGLPILGIRRPLPPSRLYVERETEVEYGGCPDPYDASPIAQPPGSAKGAERIQKAIRAASQTPSDGLVSVPWTEAKSWIWEDGTFEVTADVGLQLRRYGPGVYTVYVVAIIDSEEVPISQYSIFHGVTPPDTYSR